MDNDKLKIRKKSPRKGPSGYDVISVRVPVHVLSIIEDSAEKTNRSRNEFINMLLCYSIDHMEIEE